METRSLKNFQTAAGYFSWSKNISSLYLVVRGAAKHEL